MDTNAGQRTTGGLPAIRCCAFTVRGRVQGVGFRRFVVEAARELGLNGWVRNDGDGTVVGAAEGSAAALLAFGERLRQGPRFARVDAVELRDESPTGVAGFNLR